MFRSAARAHGPRVIGAVLTGNLDDGTVGLQAVQQCGGVTIVQDPKDAAHGSMPSNAMRYVKVDHCVSIADMPALFLRLVGEAPGQAAGEPKEVEIEADIAQQNFDTRQFLKHLEAIGTRTTFACPLCSGSIWQIGKADPLRFRCHVGHAFTAEYFWAEQSQLLENALWSAVRIMEEKVTFARQFAARMRENRLEGMALKYEKHAQVIDKELGVIRDVIVVGKGTTRNVFEER